MCGIAGILRVWPAAQRELALATPPTRAIPEHWLDLLDESVRHRGPDGHGRFRDRSVRNDGSIIDIALVHRRLSILDHAGGLQPMLSLGGGQGVVHGPSARPSDELGVYRHGEAPLHGQTASAEARARHPSGAHDRVCVVFNGCIYNHRALRAELQAAGHVFGTDHSDTEVLVHGWREWGRSLPERLEGMFAFAVWDGARGTLFIARDAFGEKPLYTLSMRVQIGESDPGTLVSVGPPPQPPYQPSPYFAFASTPAALERLDAAAGIAERVHRRDDARSRREALIELVQTGYGAWPISRAWEQPPGQSEIIGALPVNERGEEIATGGGAVESARSFTPPGVRGRTLAFSAARSSTGEGLTPERVDALLRSAVEGRLEADVALGCFLSGGVDSSLIACHAARARPDLRTFCVRMPDERYDESRFAAEVARLLGTRHETLDCTPEPAADLVRLIEQLGEPFGDSSLLPTYWVAKAAGRQVRVALTGDGGDEFFAGYERHRASILIERLRGPLALMPSRLLDSPDPRSVRTRIRRLIHAARGSPLESIFSWTDANALVGGAGVDPASRSARLPGPRAGAVAQWLFSAFTPARTVLSRELTAGLHHLRHDLMRKVDTGAMAVPLETRAPFLDSRLVGAVLSADPLDLMPRGQRKGLLRKVARLYLPSAIVDRPKMGFAIPIGDWFRTDFGGLRTLLLDHLHSSEPFGPPSLGLDLDMRVVRRMLDEHLGTGPSGQITRDHSQRLYMLLVLSIWARWVARVRSAEAVSSDCPSWA